jgi:uncharacterized protein
MGWSALNTSEITSLLREAKSVAIVGVSDKSIRPSHGVARYLLENSHFNLYFVNPALDELFGQKVYKSISDIPVAIDIVDVFRRAEDCPEVTNEAIALGAKALWFQLGIVVPELAELAHAAGLEVVMDRCIKIDYEIVN